MARGLCPNRARARALIMAGKVLIDGNPAGKAGEPCGADASVTLKQPDHPYVGRGGVKLAGAVRRFAVDPSGCVCADIGSSTGGFVDCLLQLGAARVYAIDTGNVLAAGLRGDPRVRYMANTNARYLSGSQIPQPLDLVTIDVSFISVTKILPAIRPLLAPEGRVIALIKPQFEAGRRRVGKGGIVRDRAVVLEVVQHVADAVMRMGLDVVDAVESPITGMEGNREFFFLLRREEAVSESHRSRALARIRACVEPLES